MIFGETLVVDAALAPRSSAEDVVARRTWEPYFSVRTVVYPSLKDIFFDIQAVVISESLGI